PQCVSPNGFSRGGAPLEDSRRGETRSAEAACNKKSADFLDIFAGIRLRASVEYAGHRNEWQSEHAATRYADSRDGHGYQWNNGQPLFPPMTGLEMLVMLSNQFGIRKRYVQCHRQAE